MPHDAEEVLCDELKNNSFSVQDDESTDFTNKSYVVAFVRFVNDGEIQENFLSVAKGKIYLLSCFHIWKQKVCFWRTV
jgi:hypothetical protein